MTPEPQVGDRLNITLAGVRVIETDVHHNQGRAIRVALTTKDGSETWGAILLDSPDTIVEIATTPADELRQAALTIRSRTAIEVETGDSALAELLDHLADDMGDDGAHESEVAGPAPLRTASVYNRHGKFQPAWTAALDLARAINTSANGDATEHDHSTSDHGGHTDVTCNCHQTGCQFCDGGLWACETCGGLEGSMPTKCPGQQMTAQQSDAVYRGLIDYRDNGWVAGVPSRHCPTGLFGKTDQ